MANNTIQLWDQAWGKFNEFLNDSTLKFQFVYPFIDWTWNTPDPGYINATAYGIVNQMPHWSAIGRYSPSATGLYSAYTSMLRNCPKLTATPEQQQQLKEIEEQINQAQSTLTRDRDAMQYDFEQAQKVPPGIPPPKWEDWYEQSGWQKRIETDINVLEKLAETKSLIVAQQNPGYQEAIDASTLPTDPYSEKPGFIRSDINGINVFKANYIIDDGRDWVQQLLGGKGYPIKFTLKAYESTHFIPASWANGADDYGTSFFETFIKGAWQDMDLSKDDSSIEVEINIEAVTIMPVRPDVWYDEAYLKYLVAKDHWNPPFTTKGGEQPVFGKGGLMQLMITGMVAGYRTSFNIKMSTSTFDTYKGVFEECGGIRIGAFHIGGGYYTRMDSWTRTAENNVFSGTSTADHPFIIGLTVAEPGLE